MNQTGDSPSEGARLEQKRELEDKYEFTEKGWDMGDIEEFEQAIEWSNIQDSISRDIYEISTDAERAERLSIFIKKNKKFYKSSGYTFDEAIEDAWGHIPEGSSSFITESLDNLREKNKWFKTESKEERWKKKFRWK